MRAEGGAGPLQLLLRTPAWTPAPAAVREPSARASPCAPWACPAGCPASPAGMLAAMLPYACVLVLLGGRCHPPPFGKLAEVGREGTRRLMSPKGPWGTTALGRRTRPLCCALSALLQSHLSGTCAPPGASWALRKGVASPHHVSAPVRSAPVGAWPIGTQSCPLCWAQWDRGLQEDTGGSQTHH